VLSSVLNIGVLIIGLLIIDVLIMVSSVTHCYRYRHLRLAI